jgi:hypothetical protein
VRLEGLGKWKNFDDLIGTRAYNLPACSIMPLSTTLPRALFVQRKFKLRLFPRYLKLVVNNVCALSN